MGIGKWRLTHARKSEDVQKLTSSPPAPIVDPSDDMELAYVHVRYQKSFDVEEKKLQEEKYNQMKMSRQNILEPINTMGIKKFSKQYENIKKEMTQQKKRQRLKSEVVNPYSPPRLSKIGQKCFEEEKVNHEQEELKRAERLNAGRKREKYWLLVRDLHPPKVSDVKKTEMKQLINKIENKRIWHPPAPIKRNTSTKHDSERSRQQSEFSQGLIKHKVGKSTDLLSNLTKARKLNVTKNSKVDSGKEYKNKETSEDKR